MNNNLSVSIVSATKTKSKQPVSLKLPKQIFGQKVKQKLLTQAVRVYSFCKRQGTVKVKTRGEVRGSGRKIWRQKGTGRARHGDRYAPIFVGGGVAHGPQPRDWSLRLPRKMRRQALFSALSSKFKAGEILIIDGLTKLKPKTKTFWQVFREVFKLDFERHTVLLIVKEKDENILRGVRNIKNLKTLEVKLLNAYEVLLYNKIVFTKESVEELSKIFLAKNEAN